MKSGFDVSVDFINLFYGYGGSFFEENHGPTINNEAGVNALQVMERITAHLDPSEGGPEVMEMERYWHPRLSWYGPAGVGTGRGVRGFRHWHQVPFLSAMATEGLAVDAMPLDMADLGALDAALHRARAAFAGGADDAPGLRRGDDVQPTRRLHPVGPCREGR